MPTTPSNASASTRRLPARLPPATPRGWLLLAVVACALLAVCLAVLTRALAPTPDTALRLTGRAAPAFTLPAAQSQRMLPTSLSLSAATERPTVVIFFNTLCVHCLSGVRAGAALASGANAPRVLYVDTPGENAQITGQYMARLGMNPPVALDRGGHVAAAYQVAYYPTAVVIDRQGVVRGVWTGALSAATIRAATARLG